MQIWNYLYIHVCIIVSYVKQVMKLMKAIVSNNMFNIHAFTCTCMIQLQILVYKYMYVTFKFYAGTSYKDYNVMLKSEV